MEPPLEFMFALPRHRKCAIKRATGGTGGWLALREWLERELLSQWRATPPCSSGHDVDHGEEALTAKLGEREVPAEEAEHNDTDDHVDASPTNPACASRGRTRAAKGVGANTRRAMPSPARVQVRAGSTTRPAGGVTACRRSGREFRE